MSIKILDRPVIDYVTMPVLGECLLNTVMSVSEENILIPDISLIGTWLRDYGLFKSVPIQNLGQSKFDYLTTADFKKSPSNIWIYQYLTTWLQPFLRVYFKFFDRLVIDYVTTPVLGECLLNKLMSIYKEYI